MAYGGNIGQPWLHKGVKCAKCEVTPICGYRYKCKKRPDYDLCQACFRREIPDPKIKYLKIERSKVTGPYQVHFIECAECGVAPIKGKRYQHKTQADCDLCETCYLRATNPSNRRAQSESDYELFEELIVNSVCRRYNQVFHFDKRCDECLVSPICGPTFTSIKNPDYDLCAFCHDEKLQSDSIRQGDFVSREKPDVSAVYHLNMICCLQCGMTPIRGPAFKHKRDPNKTLCLVCFYHVLEDKQRYFLRVEPPRQADKGGSFTLKPKVSLQSQASVDKATASKASVEASGASVTSAVKTPPPPPSTDASSSVTNDTSPSGNAEAQSRKDHVPTQEASSASSDAKVNGEPVSRGHGWRRGNDSNGNSTEPSDSTEGGKVPSQIPVGGRNGVKSNGTATSIPDSTEEAASGGAASGSYPPIKSILKSNASDSKTTSSSDEDAAATRPQKSGGSSVPKPSSTNSTATSDSNEEGSVGAVSRGYARKGVLKTSASDSKLLSDSDEDGPPTVSRKSVGSSTLKPSVASTSTTADSTEEGGGASRGYPRRSILQSSASDPKFFSDSDDDEGPTIPRRFVGSSTSKPSMANATRTSDSNEEELEGGVTSGGYPRRSILKSSSSDSRLFSDSDDDAAAPTMSRKYGGSSILKSSTTPVQNEEWGATSRGSHPGRSILKSSASDSKFHSDSDEDLQPAMSRKSGGSTTLKSSMANTSTASDSNEDGYGGTSSRGYTTRSALKTSASDSMITSDSDEDAPTVSRGFGGRNIQKPSSANTNEDGGLASRGYPRRGILKTSASDSMITSDSDEDSFAKPRGFGGRNIHRSSMASSNTVSQIEIVEIDPNGNTTGMTSSRGYGGGTRASMHSSVPPGRTPSPSMRSRPTTDMSGTSSIPPGRTPSPSMRNRPTTESNGTASIPPGRTPSPTMRTSRITVTEITGTSVPPGRAPSPNFRNRGPAAGPPAPLYTAGLKTNRPASPRLNRSPPSSEPGKLQSALKVPSSNPSSKPPGLRVTFADLPSDDDSD